MRKFLFLLILAISISLTASSKSAQQAVTMVSYEQSWLDHEGTLALKNNTDEDIRNVSYRILYLDMSGNVLDYKDYTSKVEIAPGLAKKVDIPAYEYGRNYSYYKSESSVSRPHKFKIKFQLKDYNLPDEEVQSYDYSYNGLPSAGYDSTFDEMKEENHSVGIGGWPSLIAMLFVLSLMLGVGVGLIVLVAVMAKKRNRNAALWILISLLSTPLLAIILLICLGQSDDE